MAYSQRGSIRGLSAGFLIGLAILLALYGLLEARSGLPKQIALLIGAAALVGGVWLRRTPRVAAPAHSDAQSDMALIARPASQAESQTQGQIAASTAATEVRTSARSICSWRRERAERADGVAHCRIRALLRRRSKYAALEDNPNQQRDTLRDPSFGLPTTASDQGRRL